MDYFQIYIRELQETLAMLTISNMAEAVWVLHNARLKGRRVYIMGNGGSASTASHFVCDLAKNTRVEQYPDYCVIGLADNMAILSAYANDEGYENVFVRQLSSLVRGDDVVIGISASGNSANVLKAIRFANDVGATTIGLTGFDGGKLIEMVDVSIHVPSNRIAQVEDVHLAIEHMICSALRRWAEQGAVAEAEKISTHDATQFIDAPRGEWYEEALESREGRSSERESRTVDMLYTLSRELITYHELLDFVPRALELMIEQIRASSGSIILLNDRGEFLNGAVYYAGKSDFAQTNQITDTLEHGLAGWVVQNGQTALISSTANDPRWLQRPWDNQSNESRSALSVPLIDARGVKGVLTIAHSKQAQFTEFDLLFLAAAAVCISVLSFQVSGSSAN